MAPKKKALSEFYVKTGGCWLWQGTTERGYGRYYVGIVDGKAKRKQAHVAVYETLVGEIPEGMVLDHLCRNRLCVNPEHLEPVTPLENLARGKGTNARGIRDNMCMRGLHELTEDNIYHSPSKTTRQCKTCHNERRRKK